MSDKKRNNDQSATDKELGQSKHQSHGGEIDGLGGASGASGASGVRETPGYIGEVSGIDPELDSDEIPMPGSTGRAGPDDARAGHREGGMSGKNRGNSTDTEPSRSGGNG